MKRTTRVVDPTAAEFAAIGAPFQKHPADYGRNGGGTTPARHIARRVAALLGGVGLVLGAASCKRGGSSGEANGGKTYRIAFASFGPDAAADNAIQGTLDGLRAEGFEFFLLAGKGGDERLMLTLQGFELCEQADFDVEPLDDGLHHERAAGQGSQAIGTAQANFVVGGLRGVEPALVDQFVPLRKHGVSRGHTGLGLRVKQPHGAAGLDRQLCNAPPHGAGAGDADLRKNCFHGRDYRARSGALVLPLLCQNHLVAHLPFMP